MTAPERKYLITVTTSKITRSKNAKWKRTLIKRNHPWSERKLRTLSASKPPPALARIQTRQAPELDVTRHVWATAGEHVQGHSGCDTFQVVDKQLEKELICHTQFSISYLFKSKNLNYPGTFKRKDTNLCTRGKFSNIDSRSSARECHNCAFLK